MDKHKPILADHKKVKTKLVTPFNAALGPVRDVSWINTMVPELLWIALVQEKYGLRRGVEIIMAFTRDVSKSDPSRHDVIWAAAGKYASIPIVDLQAIVQLQAESYAEELCAALEPLASWYPTHPLNGLLPSHVPRAFPESLAHLKAIVGGLIDRSSRKSMLVQATAICLAFESGKLPVAPHLALAEFHKIEDYPNTERSKEVAASIRATLNLLFGDTNAMASETGWPVAFWNRGLEIAPCEDQ